MSWNHRILATEHKGEITFGVYEVYYNFNKPVGYIECKIHGHSLRDITWTLYKMLQCRKKPILWAGKKFPQEFKLGENTHEKDNQSN